MNQTAYAKAGVNIGVGDAFSAFCGEICRASFENSRNVKVQQYSQGGFRGPRSFNFVGLPPGWKLSAGSDGVGTKVVTIVAAGMEEAAASNILAMTGGDFTRHGGIGLVLINNLDIASLGGSTESEAYELAQKLMRGLAVDAKNQNYVILGGETAEMRDCITSEDPDAKLKFTWSATMIGAFHPDKMITGRWVESGDRVIALKDGVRSNAGSLIRADLRRRYGQKWYLKTSKAARRDIEEAAAPSALYDRFLAHINGWNTHGFKPVVNMKLISHLSGGGIRGKFGEDFLFPNGWSARLDNLWEPPMVLKKCLGDPKVTEEELYSVSGCGQGALVVVDPRESVLFIKKAKEFGIEARDAGAVYRSGRPHITIENQMERDEIVLTP